MKLTDATIRALRPRQTRYDVYDDDVECFGIRVTPRGVKSFTFFYRLRGRKKRLSLGVYPSVSLAEARAKAHVARGTVKGERRHPDIRTRSPEDPPDGLTIGGLCDLYLASDKFRNAREATRAWIGRIVRVEILPSLGDRQLATIPAADLADWTQGILIGARRLRQTSR